MSVWCPSGRHRAVMIGPRYSLHFHIIFGSCTYINVERNPSRSESWIKCVISRPRSLPQLFRVSEELLVSFFLLSYERIQHHPKMKSTIVASAIWPYWQAYPFLN